MATILVTGGAGYIGSHTAKALAEAGHAPVVLDNLSTGHEDFVRWGPLVKAELADTDAVRAALREHRPDAVIHFAASAYVGESVTDPAKYYRNNVVATLLLLDAMRAEGVGRIVFSSTCAVYGQPDRQPITEDMPMRPMSPYGRSKMMIERILEDYHAAYGLAAIALRYFNACGDDRDGEIGERHDPEPHLVPRAVLAAMGKLDDFAVFGTDYATPDGSAVRDYIHVEDLAEAHVRAAARLIESEAPISEVFNLGTGEGQSVLDVVRAVGRALNSNVPVRYGPRREGDPALLIADPSRARDRLGFTASRSSLDNIVASAARWHAREEGRMPPLTETSA